MEKHINNNMNELIDEFMSLKKFAIVGATDNPEKFGNKIVRDLKKRGYDIYPINPRLERIEGVACYSSLSDLPIKVDVVNLVVPPKVTEEVVKECCHLELKRIWMQPGAESDKALEYCRSHGLNVIHGVCVMMSGPDK